MYKTKLETENLILRKAAMNDVNDMYHNIWSQEETAKFMLWTPVKNMEEAKDRMIRTIEYQKDRIAYLVHEKQNGQAIGFAGMTEIEGKVYEDSGIAIGSNYVGRGYGKQILMALADYCFEELDANKIICSCRSNNIASKKMQLSCGFHYTHFKDMIDRRDGSSYVLEFYERNRSERIARIEKIN